MFVVELFVPLDRGDGSEVRAEEIDTILRDLTNRFGGATAFTRAPATGLWKDGAETTSDRIIIIEIMADAIDESWWADYRTRLETQFKQDKILVRGSRCSIL